MSRRIELLGRRFERLTVSSRSASDHRGEARWVCQCDCGRQIVVYGGNLRSGMSKSCGCLTGDNLRRIRKTHGRAGTSEYRSWQAMRKRCSNPKEALFHRYGGRGIRVCASWEKFENFIADMGDRPSPHHTLERLNNDGNYEPSNCVWATRLAQARNKSDNRLVSYRGVVVPLTEAIDLAGNAVKRTTVRNRLNAGWDAADALELTPSLNRKRHQRHPSAK